jgi:hypothetical protein
MADRSTFLGGYYIEQSTGDKFHTIPGNFLSAVASVVLMEIRRDRQFYL